MRGKKVGPDAAGRTNGVDKHVPPTFLARRDARRSPLRWWRGITPAGKITVCIVALLLIALVAGLSVSLSGSNTRGTDVKPAKRVPDKKPPVTAKPEEVPLYSYSDNHARLDVAVLASGLMMTLKAMSDTSLKLENDLKATYGDGESVDYTGTLAPFIPASLPGLASSESERLSASLDVLADGSDGALPAQPTPSGSEVGARYIERYRAYLALLTSIRASAESVPTLDTGNLATLRTMLIKACDDLTRDTSAIIAGLERLGADPSEDASIAAGIQAASRRVTDTEKSVDRLLAEIRGQD